MERQREIEVACDACYNLTYRNIIKMDKSVTVILEGILYFTIYFCVLVLRVTEVISISVTWYLVLYISFI